MADIRSGQVGRTLRLTDVSHLTKVHGIAAPSGNLAATLRVEPGRCAARSDHGLTSCPAPGEWMVISPAPPGAVLEELRTAAGTEFATVVDLTSARTLLRLEGAHSAAVLAKLCAVDLSDRGTPPGSALRSSIAKVVTDVLVPPIDSGDPTTPTYLMHVDRSLGQYLFECVIDAGTEFGIEAHGPGATES